MTLAEKIISFNERLEFNGTLPDAIQIMNPFKTNPQILNVTSQFYQKFYSNSQPRSLILGINPGKSGAGVTGIPFTDTIRLSEKCGINTEGIHSYEPSSQFIYEMIEVYGGVKEFYSKYYINSVCPLGFTRISEKGKTVNCNYYDFMELIEAVYKFILQSLRTQLSFGLITDICYCLGNTDNFDFLDSLNKENKLFDKIVPLPHPSFIMRNRSKKEFYIENYLQNLKK